MYFDRRYHSPMKFQNIRNSKRFRFFSLISAPTWLIWGPKFPLYRILGYEQIVLKNIFSYNTAPKASSMLHTKKQIKKAINIEERAQKLKKSCFQWISRSIRLVQGPKFSLWLDFYAWPNHHQKYFLLLNCSRGLPHSTHKKSNRKIS